VIAFAPLDFGCFARDFVHARDLFRAAAGEAGFLAARIDNPNPGPRGEQLSTDVAWKGPDDARAVLVTVSATHGAEGFCGSGAQVDWLRAHGRDPLPDGVAVLMVHAINCHGFAWLRRVTEEGVDLNRNFVDFTQPLPVNTGYEALRDAFVPRELSGPAFAAAEDRIRAWRAEHGERAFQIARSGGQYTHAQGFFYGGAGPTWARRTLEGIVDSYRLADRELVAVIDYHTGLGPFGYGELICDHTLDSPNVVRVQRWYGESVTQPQLGTSSSVPKTGLSEIGWERMLGDRVSSCAIEYGTYSPERGRRALREDHWLHAYGRPDFDDPETLRIKAQIKKQFYPESDDWHEMVLVRSRQVIRQALAGLAEG
jgi:hypothetical protein